MRIYIRHVFQNLSSPPCDINSPLPLSWGQGLSDMLASQLQRVFTILEVKWFFLVSVKIIVRIEVSSEGKNSRFPFLQYSYYTFDRSDLARQHFLPWCLLSLCFRVTGEGGASKYSTLKLIHHQLSMTPSPWYPFTLLIENIQSPKLIVE